MKKEINFRRFMNSIKIITPELNKKACTQLDWVSRLTYKFGNNYG
jgi:hypothetical protein